MFSQHLKISLLPEQTFSREKLFFKNKKIVYKSTIQKEKDDNYLLNLQNNDRFQILTSKYMSKNEIVPWVYFYIIVDKTKNSVELVIYYIKEISEFENQYQVCLDSNRRILNSEEFRNTINALHSQ